MSKYETRRPPRKVLEDIMRWLSDNRIHLYTGCADLETGQRKFGCMDLNTVDDVIAVYNLNVSESWKDPEY